MDEENTTCKTCNQFSGHANYCHAHDFSHAEWDTCGDHETYDEFNARMRAFNEKVLKDTKVKKDMIEAIEIILNLHYVEGDMNEKEALDEICHLVLPESRPSMI